MGEYLYRWPLWDHHRRADPVAMLRGLLKPHVGRIVKHDPGIFRQRRAALIPIPLLDGGDHLRLGIGVCHRRKPFRRIAVLMVRNCNRHMEDRRTLPHGILRDYPAYEVRGIKLDVAADLRQVLPHMLRGLLKPHVGRIVKHDPGRRRP